MSTIKLPKKSIQFFKNNQDKIFKSGKLAEGPWNDELSTKIRNITKAKNAISVNSNGSALQSTVNLPISSANLPPRAQSSNSYVSVLDSDARKIGLVGTCCSRGASSMYFHDYPKGPFCQN